MAIRRGMSAIIDPRRGLKAIVAAYVGTTQVWPLIPGTPSDGVRLTQVGAADPRITQVPGDRRILQMRSLAEGTGQQITTGFADQIVNPNDEWYSTSCGGTSGVFPATGYLYRQYFFSFQSGDYSTLTAQDWLNALIQQVDTPSVAWDGRRYNWQTPCVQFITGPPDTNRTAWFSTEQFSSPYNGSPHPFAIFVLNQIVDGTATVFAYENGSPAPDLGFPTSAVPTEIILQ